mgnify:CR=1 FL=1
MLDLREKFLLTVREFMSVVECQFIIDKIIDFQNRAIRYYLMYAVGLVLFGIIVISTASLLSERLLPDAYKDLFSLGGAFISSLSAFQIKEVIERKEKIAIFKTIKLRLYELDNLTTQEVKDDKKRLEDLLWQIVEKTAIG